MKKEEQEINELKLPYASPGQADSALDIFRRMSLKKVSSKFIVDNNLATSSNAFRIMDFWRWLGVIDEGGNVNQEVANKLKMVGEERDKFIVELIKKSYKLFFESLNLMEVKKDDVINFIIHEYKIGGSAAILAARLFLHLCQKYNLPMSEGLKKKIYKRRTEKQERKQKVISTVKERKDFSSLKPTVSIPEGTFVLSIEGSGLSKSLSAHNKEELQEIYEGRFKDFIEAAKLLFPEREKQTEEEKSEEQS